MGTHPIFESDFDCLTVKMKNVELGREIYEKAGLEGDWRNRENSAR